MVSHQIPGGFSEVRLLQKLSSFPSAFLVESYKQEHPEVAVNGKF